MQASEPVHTSQVSPPRPQAWLESPGTQKLEAQHPAQGPQSAGQEQGVSLSAPLHTPLPHPLWQMPETHPWLSPQGWSQPPQWRRLDERSTQDPLQLTRPGLHAAAQWPSLQTCPESQARPQAPQFEKSLSVSTQRPEQGISSGGHSITQAPSEQVSTAPHSWPQVPQLAWSLAVSVHVPPQSVRPKEHGPSSCWTSSGSVSRASASLLFVDVEVAHPANPARSVSAARHAHGFRNVMWIP